METIEEKLYDFSWIRHENFVPKERLLEMSVGQRALVKLESGTDPVDFNRMTTYRDKVKCALDEDANNYSIKIEVIDNKYGVVVKRIK